jgi:hypothetical protein
VHVPASPQSAEQQSLSPLQALPAVLQVVFRLPHAPSMQEPLQHSWSVSQTSLSDVQASAAHLPAALHWNEQHSVGEAQFCPAVEQAPTTDAQVSVLGSQIPEQHSVLCTQVAPNALQSGPKGPLPEVPLPPTALAPATGLLLAPPSS